MSQNFNQQNDNKNNLRPFSHIVEDNVVILNMLKEKHAFKKETKKIDKDTYNQQLRNNKNTNMSADFGLEDSRHSQLMSMSGFDYDKAVTQEDQTNLNQYLNIKNNFSKHQRHQEDPSQGESYTNSKINLRHSKYIRMQQQEDDLPRNSTHDKNQSIMVGSEGKKYPSFKEDDDNFNYDNTPNYPDSYQADSRFNRQSVENQIPQEPVEKQESFNNDPNTNKNQRKSEDIINNDPNTNKNQRKSEDVVYNDPQTAKNQRKSEYPFQKKINPTNSLQMNKNVPTQQRSTVDPFANTDEAIKRKATGGDSRKPSTNKFEFENAMKNLELNTQDVRKNSELSFANFEVNPNHVNSKKSTIETNHYDDLQNRPEDVPSRKTTIEHDQYFNNNNTNANKKPSSNEPRKGGRSSEIQNANEGVRPSIFIDQTSFRTDENTLPITSQNKTPKNVQFTENNNKVKSILSNGGYKAIDLSNKLTKNIEPRTTHPITNSTREDENDIEVIPVQSNLKSNLIKAQSKSAINLRDIQEPESSPSFKRKSDPKNYINRVNSNPHVFKPNTIVKSKVDQMREEQNKLEQEIQGSSNHSSNPPSNSNNKVSPKDEIPRKNSYKTNNVNNKKISQSEYDISNVNTVDSKPTNSNLKNSPHSIQSQIDSGSKRKTQADSSTEPEYNVNVNLQENVGKFTFSGNPVVNSKSASNNSKSNTQQLSSTEKNVNSMDNLKVNSDQRGSIMEMGNNMENDGPVPDFFEREQMKYRNSIQLKKALNHVYLKK